MLGEINETTDSASARSGLTLNGVAEEEKKPKKGRRNPDTPKPDKKEKTPEQKGQTAPWLAIYSAINIA